MTKLERRLADTEATVTTITQQHTRHERATADLAALDTQLQALPPAEDEAALSTLRTRIAKGRDNLAAAEGQHAAARAWGAYDEQQTALVQDQAVLERLCVAYGPKGIRERLLGERLGALTARVNTILVHFGRQVSFTTEPWSVRLAGVPPALMARSALFRVGLAFQIALAQVTGLKVAILDGIDILDGPNRAALFAVVERALAEGWVEQVVILATVTSEAAFAKAWPESWGVFRIAREGEASSIHRIEAAQVAVYSGHRHGRFTLIQAPEPQALFGDPTPKPRAVEPGGKV